MLEDEHQQLWANALSCFEVTATPSGEEATTGEDPRPPDGVDVGGGTFVKNRVSSWEGP